MKGADREPGPSHTTKQVIDMIGGIDQRLVERDRAIRDAHGDVPLQLRIGREFAGVDHHELALMANIDATTIASIEDGSHDPTTTTLGHLAAALGIEFVVGKSSAA